MPYAIELETPNHEVEYIVTEAHFSSEGIQLTGLDPSNVSEDMREYFQFHPDHALTAKLTNTEAIESIMIGEIPASNLPG
jgi:hypothetical protein